MCSQMKILIIADSLALPRGNNQGNISYEETYPYLLLQSLRQRLGPQADVLLKGKPYRTILDILPNWSTEVIQTEVDVVIIQVGVVDCAPRVLLARQHEFVIQLHPIWLRYKILKFINRHRREIITRFPNRVYVPLHDFKAEMEYIIQTFHRSRVKRLVFVNIVSPPESLDYRSPGFKNNVKAYNRCLAGQISGLDRVSLVDLDRMIIESGGSEKLTVDGMHINFKGHQLLTKALQDLIIPASNFEQPQRTPPNVKIQT